MKVSDPLNPVRLSWVLGQDARLDARPFVGGAYEARARLEGLRVPVQALRELTAGHDGGLYNGPQFRRIFVTDQAGGVPFLGSADMLESDLSRVPLLSRAEAKSSKLAYLRLTAGTTLVSCSGTIGRVAYTRPAMDGMWSSQDTIKVVPDREQIPSGFLNAVLASRYGTPILIHSRTGTGIRHLEPHQIADLPVPRFGERIERAIHDLVEEAAQLRTAYQEQLVAATADLFATAGLADLAELAWHDEPRDLGFTVGSADLPTLRALNYGPRAQSISSRLASVPHRTLGDICRTLTTGARFARVAADPELGARLVGQRQAFWSRPEGRWISLDHAPRDVRVVDETVLVAAHGTLGDNEVYARSILVTGSWLEHVYSQDFVRVVSGDDEMPGAYLFALLRSDALFRMLRSLSVGGKQQEYHPRLLRAIPVPLVAPAARERIVGIVRAAHRNRDLADQREDEAAELLERAVEGASG